MLLTAVFLATLSIVAALPTSSLSNDTSDYEYIVVGSGPGGAPLAARLAIAGHKTLLIDAGDDQGDNINYKVPAFQGLVTEDENLSWNYYVKHYSDDARAARDQKMEWDTPDGKIYRGQNPPSGSKMKGILYPRAGTVGGCGSHNALITVYPHNSDWDNIASITGDDSWSAPNMRKYFERLEKAEYLNQDTQGHGRDGWLHVNEPDIKVAALDFRIAQQLLAAASAIGKGIFSTFEGLIKVFTTDPNGLNANRDSATGLYQVPLAMDSKKLRNGPRDFVIATLNARNPDGSKKYPLEIRTDTLVTKLIFIKTSSGPKATGVNYLQGKSLYSADPRYTGAQGTPGSVTASKEVIISAGAFNTPQLLKLSGVGPQDELIQHNIPVVKDLPGVGTNMQDRYEITVTSSVEKEFNPVARCRWGQPGDDACLDDWSKGKLGVYGTNGFSGAIMTRSSVAADSNNDLFVFGGPVNFTGYYTGWAQEAIGNAKHWTWGILKAHTTNKAGTVKLRSGDPRDTPDISFNYFDTGSTDQGQDQRDLTAVVDGVKLIRKIYQSAPWGTPKFTENLPGPQAASDDSVKDFVKDNAWGHHASCTCPIGADNDKMAVLDSKFRVRGVQGLRVVDASAFPDIPGFFIVTPIYMISEKAADVILADSEKLLRF